MKKVLVANRGEIAVRIMRSLKEMGIATVAVYSDADRRSMHRKYADESVYIGEAPSQKSYLNGARIVEVAKDMGCDGIHPGYGFLSENSTFAQLVESSGLIFIGPSAEAMELMGNKLSAKTAAKNYEVPLLPGTETPVSTLEDAAKHCERIGYPVLIKAAAGGGGKGMRIVESAEALAGELERASSEALAAFGDGSVFLEKYVASPKHIEIQVLSDSHGNHVYLFDRECSIQRRHQKVIEEAPSMAVDADLRKQMGESAVRIAKACNYRGAGTVEFIMDEAGKYYFLEMNTRLQVEHPVTELITGIDLVKEQVRVARGEKLGYSQDDLSYRGHAIELRVYAEDPSNGFLPDIGKLHVMQLPQGPGIRVDSGLEEGMDVPVYYDPMISKLIVYAATREEAIARMIRAIDEYKVVGIATTLSFGKFVMQHEDFKNGKFDTHFVSRYFTPEKLVGQWSRLETEAIATVMAKHEASEVEDESKSWQVEASHTDASGGWKARGWRAR